MFARRLLQRFPAVFKAKKSRISYRAPLGLAVGGVFAWNVLVPELASPVASSFPAVPVLRCESAETPSLVDAIEKSMPSVVRLRAFGGASMLGQVGTAF